MTAQQAAIAFDRARAAARRVIGEHGHQLRHDSVTWTTDELEEEMIAAGLARLARVLSDYREGADFGAFCYRVCYWQARATLTRLRLDRPYQYTPVRFDALLHDRPDTEATDAEAERQSLRAALERAMRALRPAEAEAVRLIYLDGLGYEGAAEATGKSPNNLSVHAARAYRTLRPLVANLA